METKWLSIQSFKRNQGLIDHLNKLLVYYKLKILESSDEVKQQDIDESKTVIESFLKKILDFTANSTNREAILGVDSRLRSFVRSFEDAKSRKRQFKSRLFKESPYEILELLKNPYSKDELEIIVNSLTDLRTIVETHNSVDLKELIESI
jgi:hypothetical protein